MQRRLFLVGFAAALLARPARAQSRRREERQRVEERAQERREQRRESEEHAAERRIRRRADEERAQDRRERLNQAPPPPYTPTRPLDQPLPPAP